MKKILLIIAVAATMSFASCGSKAPADTVETADSTETVAEEKATAETEVADENSSAVIELKADDTVAPDALPVVVDFNATWCGPCKAFAPTFHKVAAEYAGKAVFASADVDVCEALAKENKVTSIPDVIIFYPASTGRATVSHEGLMTEDEFKAFLDKNL